MVRDRSIVLRFTEREKQQLRKQAGREPLSAWMRRILLEHCARREKSKQK